MSDDDDCVSDDDDDDSMTDYFNDADVSRMAIETKGEMHESTSEGEPSCSGWSESLAEGRQEVIDDDEYNEAVKMVMKEEATTESNGF